MSRFSGKQCFDLLDADLGYGWEGVKMCVLLICHLDSEPVVGKRLLRSFLNDNMKTSSQTDHSSSADRYISSLFR